MKTLSPVIGFIVLILLMFPVGATTDSPALNDSYHQEMKDIIRIVSDQIISGLSTLETENRKSAEELSRAEPGGEEVHGILNTKVASSPYIHSSLIITPDGIVTAASPDRYSGLIGDNLSDQHIVRFANQQQGPVLSDIFLLKEGFYGVSLSYPIFNESGDYQGYTDITFKPEEFLRQYIIPVVEQNNYDMFILDTNGTNIYETNEEEIGKNTLTDPLYTDPEIHQTALAITGNRSGEIRYHFWNRNWDRSIEREAVWDTLEFDKQKWRVAIVRDIDQDDGTEVLKNGTGEVKEGDLNASITSLTKYVNDAAAFAHEQGREEALSSFNNLSGPFVSGDRYIFAYDMNATTLALPYQAGLIGKNRSNMTDANGLEIMPGLMDLAKNGGGIMYYVYPNPAEEYKPQLKLVFVTPVDGDWFIGSGIYLPFIQAVVDKDTRDSLIQRVENAVRHSEDVGKEKAIDDFNDINGSYADGGDYIFAYEFDGTTLALPHQPEIIGTSRINYTDKYGSPIIRQEIDAAKRGGGYVYIVYYNPDTRSDNLKLCFVSPAGKDWLVGSGFNFNQDLQT